MGRKVEESKTNKHLNRMMRATRFVHLFVNGLSELGAWEVAASVFYFAMAGKLNESDKSTRCLLFRRNEP